MKGLSPGTEGTNPPGMPQPCCGSGGAVQCLQAKFQRDNVGIRLWDVLRHGAEMHQAERAQEFQRWFLMLNAHFAWLAGLANQLSASLESSCCY